MSRVSDKPEAFPGRSLHESDWIRLVNILPGDDTDPLALQLFETRLSRAPRYEGLSYVWGDSLNAETTVTLRYKAPGRDETACELEIKPNCFAALTRLRSGIKTPRCVWVDAICIFQHHTDERSHQVKLMSQIYKSAAQVVVYLGEEADASGEAMDWISEIAAPSYNPTDRGVESDTRKWIRELRPSITMLEALFARPWFKRTWVLQEVALARSVSVVCGDRTVDWECFQTFRTFNVTSKWLKTLPVVVRISQAVLKHGSYAARLVYVLKAARQCQATDPRDKLYALLPLLQQFRQDAGIESEDAGQDKIDVVADLDVDYRRPDALVAARLASYLIEYLGPDILNDVSSSSLSPNAVSWAPDWSPTSAGSIFTWRSAFEAGASLRSSTNDIKRSLARSRFDAGLSSGYHDDATAHDWKILRGPDLDDIGTYRLQGHGVFVGAIKAISDMCMVDNDYLPLTKWRRLMPESQLLQQIPVRGPTTDLFTRVLTMDDIVYPSAVSDALEILRRYDELDVKYSQSRKAEDLYKWWPKRTRVEGQVPMAESMRGMAPSYACQAEIILSACDEKRFFVTDTGYLGLAPAMADVGDVVFVLRNASMPFVLRRISKIRCHVGEETADGEDEQVNLVGKCYVLGVMGGEMYRDNPKEKEVTIW